jgi:hypothetical protein
MEDEPDIRGGIYLAQTGEWRRMILWKTGVMIWKDKFVFDVIWKDISNMIWKVYEAA